MLKIIPMYYQGFHFREKNIEKFPFNLPVFQNIDGLSLEKPITVFVGENGSGKSTLLKGLALAMNLPVVGSQDLDSDETLTSLQYFADQLHGSWAYQKVYNGFFFRAEDYFGFVKRLKNIDSELEQDIVDFEKKLSGSGLKKAVGSIHGQKEALKRKYGDLLKVSHGEGFLKILNERITTEGIYLIDEPEAALSPMRQLSLYSLIKNRVREGKCQFIIATHSPILMTLPDSQIFQFDQNIQEVSFEETEHFSVMKQFLNNPESFTRHL